MFFIVLLLQKAEVHPGPSKHRWCGACSTKLDRDDDDECEKFRLERENSWSLRSHLHHEVAKALEVRRWLEANQQLMRLADKAASWQRSQ